jgi:two-component system phosphate regulon response regulator PhoB
MKMSPIVYELQPGLFRGRKAFGRVRDRINVLLVKREFYLGNLMMFPLTEAGCDVDMVWTAKAALDLAQTKKFALIVLDIKLQDTSGLLLCSKLRRRSASQNATFVFLSSGRPSRRTIAGIKRRTGHYISAPVCSKLMPRLFSHINQVRANP